MAAAECFSFSALKPWPCSSGVRARRHDSIVVYDVLPSGELSGPKAHVPTGKHPRNFNLDPTGKFLLCGNAHDSTITVYSVCPQTGVPSPTGASIECPTPTRILFAPPHRTVSSTGEDGATTAVRVVHENGTTVTVSSD